MNEDAADNQGGDDGEPEFDPAAVFALWKHKDGRAAALAELGDDAEAIKTARRRLSTLGITSAANPFIVAELLDEKQPAVVAVELDEAAREQSRQRLVAYRDPKTDWRHWKRFT